jgi:pimeloyl-ACP methyl ester carboxylesterase
VAGSGPPLLCVPGGPGRASAYLEDLGGLTSDLTLWRVDLRGTGLSELPDDRESLAFPRLADDLSPVVAEAGGGPVDVLAHSAGCHVAMVFASRYPELVRRLVLLTPSANGLADAAETWPDVARIRASRSGEPWYAEVAAIEAEIAQLPEDRRRRLDRGLRPYFYARWDAAAQAHAAAAFRPEHGGPAELVEMLQSVVAPTLIVVGGLDGITGTAPGRIVADSLPKAASVDVIEMPAAGHNPWIDDPTGFASLVAGWLRDTA